MEDDECENADTFERRFLCVARANGATFFRSIHVCVGVSWYFGIISVHDHREIVGRWESGQNMARAHSSFFVLQSVVLTSIRSAGLRMGHHAKYCYLSANRYSLRDGKQLNRGGAGVRQVKTARSILDNSSSFGLGGVITGNLFYADVPHELERMDYLWCVPVSDSSGAGGGAFFEERERMVGL